MQGRRKRCTADRAMVTEGSGAGSLPGEKRKRLLWEVRGRGSQEDYGNWRCLEQQNLTEEGRRSGKDKLQSKTREEKIVAYITLFGLESQSASQV